MLEKKKKIKFNFFLNLRIYFYFWKGSNWDLIKDKLS
jgi:hypothetical protein